MVRVWVLFCAATNCLASFTDLLEEPKVSSRGRVIENYSSSQLTALDPITADLLTKRILVDENLDEYTPVFGDSLNERVPDFGIVELDELVYSSYNSVVFTVKNNYRLLVKYMHNCHNGGATAIPHPLLSQSWIQAEVATWGLAPQVFFVSPPVVMPTVLHSSPKTRFQMNPLQHLDCFLSDTTVRFAIIERISGRSLRSLNLEGHLGGIESASEFGILLVNAIAQVHAENIVHGDIAIDRIAIVNNFTEFNFINFGSASRTDQFGFAFNRIRSLQDREYLKSPWELTGNGKYTKRDDLFRIMQVVARIMNPFTYLINQQRMILNGESGRLLAWKSDGNIFVPPSVTAGLNGGPDPVMMLPISPERRESIRSKLYFVQFFVRACDPQPSVHVYESLVVLFTQILDIIREPELASPFLPTPSSPSSTTRALPRVSSASKKRKRDHR
jgi:serine/threonine protein kinase